MKPELVRPSLAVNCVGSSVFFVFNENQRGGYASTKVEEKDSEREGKKCDFHAVRDFQGARRSRNFSNCWGVSCKRERKNYFRGCDGIFSRAQNFSCDDPEEDSLTECIASSTGEASLCRDRGNGL